jgi:hypothetical protein
VAQALTADHKPNRQDEAARVEAAGGKVLHKGGSHRVMGLLAMSRAIGDHFLRPFIVAEPEVGRRRGRPAVQSVCSGPAVLLRGGEMRGRHLRRRLAAAERAAGRAPG